MLNDQKSALRTLEAIAALVEDAERLLHLEANGHYAASEQLAEKMLPAARKLMSHYAEGIPICQTESIAYSLLRIFALVMERSSGAAGKIEFELLPLIKDLYLSFYFYNCVYPDGALMEKYYKSDMISLGANKYSDESVKTGHYKYDLSISVLAFNKLEYTKLCVESLLRYIPRDLKYELILINHGSTDGTKEYFESIAPTKQLDILRNSGGVGSAVRIFEGKYHLDVSNDVLVTENAIANMIRCMESDEKIVWVVPTTPNVSNYQTIPGEYNTIDEMYAFAAENNRSGDPFRWEQRARLCNPICLRRTSTAYSSSGVHWPAYYYTLMQGGFSDDKESLFYRRNGYKMMLAKDSFCYHFGSVTLGEEVAKQDSFYDRGRRDFQDAFGIDPWGTGFCWSMELMSLLPCRDGGHINILGINCGLGSNPLKIKEALKENVRNLDVTLYNVTDDEHFIKDLPGVSDRFAFMRQCSAVQEIFPGVVFNYIVVESGLEAYHDPLRVIRELEKRLAAGGRLAFRTSDASLGNNMMRKFPEATAAGEWRVIPGPGRLSMADEKGLSRVVSDEGLKINIVYGHMNTNDVAETRRGNVSIFWSCLPIEGCDHYAYHNSFSFRGRMPGLNILLMLEPAVVLPGEFDERVWSHFDYILTLFDALVEQNNKFRKLFFPRGNGTPNEPLTELPGLREAFYPLAERKNAVCMISGNKRSHVPGELYSKRIEIAEWFYKNSDMLFDVYGRSSFPLANYRGSIPKDQKIRVLRQYKYSLCFENTNHPVLSAGYVTEKMLDCLEARTIPIYLGASNIEKYVPADCFIDFRKFSDLRELENYLKNISAEEYERYVSAIDAWVCAGNVRQFSSQAMNDSLAELCAASSHKSPEVLFRGNTAWSDGPAVPPVNGWKFAGSAELWTWEQLAKADAPLINDGHIGGKRMVPGLVSIILRLSQDLDSAGKCLQSIRQHSAAPNEIIFVAPAASTKVVKWAGRQCGELERACVVEGGASFAKDINRAFHEASGEYIIVLSRDCIVTEGWLDGLLECLGSADDVGIVGPMTESILGRRGAEQPEDKSSGHLEVYARTFRKKNRYRRVTVRNVGKACMLLSRELAYKIGFFDERFETGESGNEDYCLRAELAGYRNMLAGDVFIHQDDGGNKATGGDKKIFDEKWCGGDISPAAAKKLIVLKAVERAREFYGREELDKAVNSLVEAIKHAPEDADIYYCLAEILIDSKKYAEALEALQSMPEAVMNTPKPRVLTGYCREGMGLDREAEVLAEQILSQDAGDAYALNLKGIIAHKRGDMGAAEALFKKAIETDPGYGEPYANLGILTWAAGRHGEALDLLEKGVILSPLAHDNTAAYYNAVSSLKEFERAVPVFSEAKGLYPRNRGICFFLIDLLIQQNDFKGAMEEIEEAVITFGHDEGLLSAALQVRENVGPKKIDEGSRRKGTLSVCMIVKNEERHIARSLHSLSPVADELIVVDTGSTDKTRDLAAAFGASIHDFAWTGDFSEARNYSLSKAKGDWILVHDADEVLSPLDYAALLKLLRKGAKHPVAYSIITRNYTVNQPQGWNGNKGEYPGEEAGTGWLPTTKVRLFVNDPRVRFEGPVHEVVEPSLIRAGIQIKECGIPIHHYGRLDMDKTINKAEEYYLLGIKKLEQSGDDPRALRELAIQAGELGKHEEAIGLWQRLISLGVAKETLLIALFNMGSCYFLLGKYEDSMAVSRKAMEVDPLMKENVITYACCELCIGDVKKALAAINSLPRQGEDYPLALAALTVAHIVGGNREKVLSNINKLRNMQIGLSDYLYNFATYFMKAGRYASAVTVLEASLEFNIIHDDTYALLSECREKLGAGSSPDAVLP